MTQNGFKPCQLVGQANFAVWKKHIETVLVVAECIEAIETPETATAAQKRKAKALITQLLDPTLYFLVEAEDSAKSLYDRIISKYGETNKLLNVSLKGELQEAKMTSKETVDDYFSRLQQMRAALADAGIPISDDLIEERLIVGVPPSYRSGLTSILNRDEHGLAEVLSSIRLAEALSKANLGDTNHKHEEPRLLAGTLVARAEPERQEFERTGTQRPVRCWCCKEEGHLQRDCPFREEIEAAVRAAKAKRASANHAASYSAVVLQVGCSSCNSGSAVDNFILDSGCTRHVTQYRSLLHDFTTDLVGFPEYVQMADGHRIRVEGRGQIRVRSSLTTCKSDVTFRDVLYAPGIQSGTLISLSRMLDKGVTAVYSKNLCVLNHAGNTVLTARRLEKWTAQQDLFALDHVRIQFPDRCSGAAARGNQQRSSSGVAAAMISVAKSAAAADKHRQPRRQISTEQSAARSKASTEGVCHKDRRGNLSAKTRDRQSSDQEIAGRYQVSTTVKINDAQSPEANGDRWRKKIVGWLQQFSSYVGDLADAEAVV